MLTAALNADPVKSGEAYDVPAISEGHQCMKTVKDWNKYNDKCKRYDNANNNTLKTTRQWQQQTNVDYSSDKNDNDNNNKHQ